LITFDFQFERHKQVIKEIPKFYLYYAIDSHDLVQETEKDKIYALPSETIESLIPRIAHRINSNSKPIILFHNEKPLDPSDTIQNCQFKFYPPSLLLIKMDLFLDSFKFFKNLHPVPNILKIFCQY
jgi:hypothetical protein